MLAFKLRGFRLMWYHRGIQEGIPEIIHVPNHEQRRAERATTEVEVPNRYVYPNPEPGNPPTSAPNQPENLNPYFVEGCKSLSLKPSALNPKH